MVEGETFDMRHGDADRSRVAALIVVDEFLRRSTARPRVIGLSFAVLVHVALMIALAWQVRSDVARAPAAIVDVQLVRSWPRPIVLARNRSVELKGLGATLAKALGQVRSGAGGNICCGDFFAAGRGRHSTGHCRVIATAVADTRRAPEFSASKRPDRLRQRGRFEVERKRARRLSPASRARRVPPRTTFPAYRPRRPNTTKHWRPARTP